MDAETLATALAPISETLAIDGYDVSASPAGEGVAVVVSAGPNACDDCLVPKSIMSLLVAQALADAGHDVPAERIVLTYPTD